MPGPQAAEINLPESIEQALIKLENGHTTAQQIAKRAKIIRLLGAGQTEVAVAAEVGVSRMTVRHWRASWLSLVPVPLKELSVAERLEDLPRSGAPPRITADQRCQLEAIACQPPEHYGRPISQWSGRELAAEVIKQGIIESLSPRHAMRLLKRSLHSTA